MKKGQLILITQTTKALSAGSNKECTIEKNVSLRFSARTLHHIEVESTKRRPFDKAC